MREYFGIPSAEKAIKEIGRKDDEYGNLEEGLMVAKNEKLRFFHYLKLAEIGQKKHVSFEMYLSWEARALAKKHGWQKIRRILEGNIGAIVYDPFGEQSIDPGKSETTARELRTVNRISAEFE